MNGDLRGIGRTGDAEARIRRWDMLRVVGHQSFHGVPQSARAARRWAVEVLNAHACENALDTVELLVGELVANAVLHSDSREPGGAGDGAGGARQGGDPCRGRR